MLISLIEICTYFYIGSRRRLHERLQAQQMRESVAHTLTVAEQAKVVPTNKHMKATLRIYNMLAPLPVMRRHKDWLTILSYRRLVLTRGGKKDIGKLRSYEKVILGYRYWVTKNSL